MKKIFLSILTFFYLFVSSGMAMEIHYCMGKLAGADLYKSASNSKCIHCGMKDKKGGCCNNEHKFYKLSTDQQFTSNDHQYDTSFVAIEPALNFFRVEATVLSLSRSALRNNSPPGGTGIPIYIRYCNFRL